METPQVSPSTKSHVVAFAREADMLLPITQNRRQITPRGKTWDVLYELQTSQGVCDIVMVAFRNEILAERLQAAVQPVQSFAQLSTLTFLQSKHPQGAKVSTIASATATSASHIRQSILPELQRLGWIDGPHDGFWHSCHQYQLPVAGIVAIEVKRGDWQRALHQASKHRTFANQTYIALDRARLPRSMNPMLTALSFAGVGLISVTASEDAGSTIERIQHPIRRKPSGVSQALVAERALALHLAGKNSGHFGHVFGRWVTTSSGIDPRNSLSASGPPMQSDA